MLRWPPKSTRWRLWDSLSSAERETLENKRETIDNYVIKQRMKNDETYQ